MPSDMSLSGRMEKYLDLKQSPGCSVVMAQPHVATELRPGFKNDMNPFQHDRTYLNRLDISRQKVEDGHRDRRLQSMNDKMRSGGLGESGRSSGFQIHDAVLGMVPQLEVPALGRSGKSISTPSLGSKPFFGFNPNHPHSPHDSVHRARLAASQTAHMPGYRGFVPGMMSETHSIACRFSAASQKSLDQRHSERTGFLDGLQRKTWGVTAFNGGR